jgi:predicted  nucleic acid-binding Zn-ribbon protein
MRIARTLPLPALLLVTALAGCDKSKDQLRLLSHTDSARTDSIVAMKNDLLNEVMASTQFVNDLNSELAKLKSREKARLSTKLTTESDMAAIKEERAAVTQHIRELVARLDSSETRVASLRARAQKLAVHDSTLMTQVAQYEKTIADLRQTVEQQKAEYEATIAKQNVQIASLTSQVDTVTKENVRLAGERTALVDTVGQLTSEKNTAYYVIGTKDELVKQGVLVEEGHKRFFLIGGRTVAAAREFDPTKFTKIDRTKDRVINFPAGDYTIFSRQNPAYASPFASKDGKLSGGLRIDQPDRFWEPSRFLIIVRS